MGKTMRVVASFALVAAMAPGLEAQDAYRSYDQLTDAVVGIVDGSNVASVESIAQSRDGRDIWLVTLAADGELPAEDRPGILVVGTLAGDHLIGSEIAVEAVRWLTDQNGSNDEVTRLLSENVVYVVPRLNPDGAEAYFGDLAWGRRGNAWQEDDDNDARMGEDGPNDLNGDGLITVMRVADRSGDLIPHPDDARLMKEADPVEGESGTHTLYIEGLDDDGDGFIAEDGPGGVDLDRNFQHAYPYWEADAGRHMVSEPESRGLMDFMVAHTNIGAILTFGHSDNLVVPPNGGGNLDGARTITLNDWAEMSNDGVFSVGTFGGQTNFGNLSQRGAQLGRNNPPEQGQRPVMTFNGQDRPYMQTISDAYREITGIEQTGYNREAEGAFFQYGYFQYGVPSFSTQGWAMPDAEGESFELQLLALVDGAGADGEDFFVEWETFDHPTLGEVEIGGFHPYALTNPPADAIAEAGQTHAEFIARLGGMLPNVQFVEASAESIGGGLWKVDAVVENTGYLPTSLAHGQRNRAVDPTLVQIQVDPEAVVSGDAKTARTARIEGSGGTASYSWIIRGNAGQTIEITSRAMKGGLDTINVTLR